MILFGKDWKKYPSARPDLTTQNESFLRVASIYKRMGVTNHAWMLALVDQRLAGIDPRDPGLTAEVRTAIGVECYINPWYYFREVSMVPAAAGASPVQFLANRGNMSLFWLFFNGITVMLVQIRQTGKSVSSDSMMVYLLAVRSRGSDLQLITKDDVARVKNLESIKEIEELLPPYLRFRTSKDRANTERITIKALGNSYQGYVGNRSEKIAFNLGRGMTSPTMQFDELSSLPNNEIIMGAALPAGGEARTQARAAGDPNGTILTTTAGLKTTKEGRFAFKISQTSSIWTERFVDSKNLADLERTIRGSSGSEKKLRVYAEFDHLQLGRTNEWLSRTIEDSETSGDRADADFFNRWGEASEGGPIDKEDIVSIKGGTIPDVFTDISPVNMYVSRWYVPENEKDEQLRNYDHVLSADTSDMVGADEVALHLTNVTTGATAFCGTYNESNLILLAEWILNFIIDNPRVTFIIERKSSGPTIVDYIVLGLLAKNINPFHRLWNTVVNSFHEKPDAYNEVARASGRDLADLCTKHKKGMGFSTSGFGMTARSELYGVTLRQASKNVGSLVYDRKVANQICALEIINGRVDHPKGGNDDCVTAWLLGYWFITKARNLQLYGVKTETLLRGEGIISHKDRKIDSARREAQDNCMEELRALQSRYETEADYMVRARIKARIERIRPLLTEEYFDKLSVSDMVRSLERIKEIDRLREAANNNDSFMDEIPMDYSMGGERDIMSDFR